MRITSFGLALILGGIAVAGCTTMDGDSDGDATASDEIAVKPAISSFTLHVSQDENTVDIHNDNNNTFNTCPNPNGCDFAYLSGTQVTLTPFPRRDLINCVQFLRWTGDCTGGTCVILMNRDSSAHAVWGTIKGCIPE